MASRCGPPDRNRHLLLEWLLLFRVRGLPRLSGADPLIGQRRGRCGRDTVTFDVPAAGARADLGAAPERVPFGRAAIRREGTDVTICSLAVGVHRALGAAVELARDGVSCEVIDLRSVRPLDVETIVRSVRKTGRLLCADEDYREYGLSGELAAVALEAGLAPRFARVCVADTLPYAPHLEQRALPNVERIVTAARGLTAA